MDELTSNSNIIWLSDDVDNLEGFQKFYARFNQLLLDDRAPWILLNVCCAGSNDAQYSDAILQLLIGSSKPIKTQVITSAESYGVLFACVGEERVAWPKSTFMHHSFHVDFGGMVSLEAIAEQLKSLREDEHKSLMFMKSQMGDENFKRFLKDFKKQKGKNYDFDAVKAVEYNIVNRIGRIDALYFKGDTANVKEN